MSSCIVMLTRACARRCVMWTIRAGLRGMWIWARRWSVRARPCRGLSATVIVSEERPRHVAGCTLAVSPACSVKAGTRWLTRASVPPAWLRVIAIFVVALLVTVTPVRPGFSVAVTAAVLAEDSIVAVRAMPCGGLRRGSGSSSPLWGGRSG